MRVLLDTHALFWWFSAPDRLSSRARSILSNTQNQVFVSAATAWELAIKVGLGKIDATDLVMDLEHHVEEEGFSELTISLRQATRAGLLPGHHRDPVDRLLVAQAQDLNLPLLSADRTLDQYDVRRIW